MNALSKARSKLPSKESPFVFLALAGIVMTMTFSGWNALLNNFAIENPAFTGAKIGTLQSIREIPGLLAFTAAFVLLVFYAGAAIAALSLILSQFVATNHLEDQSNHG